MTEDGTGDSSDPSTHSTNDTNDDQPTATRRIGRRAFIGTAAATTVVLAGCGGDSGGTDTPTDGSDTEGSGDQTATATEAGTPTSGGTLQWGGSVPVQSLDPHFESAAASARVMENITEGLTQLNWDYEMEPLLAESWEVSDDQTEISFSLREDVQFHDGTEFTSEDVVASYERIEEGEALAAQYLSFVDSYEAPDDYTFELSLNEAYAPMLHQVSTVNMHILTAEQAEQDEIEELVGTGPYQFDSMEVDSEFVMVKNDDYWDDEYPYLDEIVKTEMPDNERRLDSLEAGEVDFINDVPPRHAETLQDNPDIDFVERFPKSLVYLGLNCNEEPFDDMDARIALDFTIDKQEVIEAALYGNGQAAASPAVPDSMWEHPDLEVRPQDFGRAQEHLDAAGYSDGFEATFKIPEQYNDQVDAAEVIAPMASEVGIELDIEMITWTNWLDDVYTNQNFQATTSSYLALSEPDEAYYSFLHPDGSLFFTGWTNDEYNELVEEARTVSDNEERASLYHDAAEMLQEERSGHILLYWTPNMLARVPEYKGEVMSPNGSAFRFQNAWME